nr:hypothetical protein [Nocardia cyriacigeorgica]
MPSPVAVRSLNVTVSRALVNAPRSVVGEVSTLAVPANVTKPNGVRCGRPAAKSRAACCAASSRDGATSVASIDSDTSRTRTTAASQETASSAAGRASPETSSPQADSAAAPITNSPDTAGRSRAIDGTSSC